MIYLDYNATTPVLPEVFAAMRPFFCEEWGNPASAYRFGAKHQETLQLAREKVAGLLGALPEEILFTSGATESNNTAIHAALAAHPDKRHIITSVTEHSSVLSYCQALEKEGFRVTYLPVDRDGLLNLEALEASLSADTAVVSLHWANNETGVLFPIQTIAELCQDHGIPLHCDAVQAAGKEVIDTRRTPVNYLSISGHKFYAPKGIGALYVRADSPFAPLIHGGHQEAGRRGGTENLPLIVGLGAAAELAGKNLPTYGTRVQPLRNALEAQVLKQVAHTEVNGHGSQRVGNTTNIAFHGLKAVAMLNLLEQAGICASKGSACTSGVGGPSHVIKAMKPDGLTARQSLRFSLGLTSTQSEVDACVATLVKSAGRLRA